MNDKLNQEIEAIIKQQNLDCSIKEFLNEVNWYDISSCHYTLSEDFITTYQNKLNWHYISCYRKLSEEFIAKYEGKVIWLFISESQKLSEEFITKYRNKVDWHCISSCQKLSEELIEKHQDNVDWYAISQYQQLSENFIAKHQGKVDWNNISQYQELSEKFITKYEDQVNWYRISFSQKLSKKFIAKYKNKIGINIYKRGHKAKSLKQKKIEVKQYAEKYNLKYDKQYLYAFRDHNKYGSGMYHSNRYYEKGKYYRDWHCDMREDQANSFGLGIFPAGNTAVKVKIADWGLEVDRDDGKCRVWGFEVI